MAESRRYSLTPQLDMQQILIEAKSRWLRPSEICEILRNYQRFNLTPDPPYKPSGGSLFLFDRKALRYFRKDGHHWRKKKDGKTVREAHEKLKSGSVDVLHCYYAHGEDNENFQRRSYWMLDVQLEHIVLVHYRDVSEGSRSSATHMFNTYPETADNTQGTPTSSAVFSTQLSTALATRACNTSSPSTTEWNEPTPSSEFEDADSGDDYGGASLTASMPCSRFQISSSPGNDMIENNATVCSGSFSRPHTSGLTETACLNRSFSPFFVNQGTSHILMFSEDQRKVCGSSQPSGSFGATHCSQHISSTTWPEVLCLNQKSTEQQEHNISFEQPNPGDGITRRLLDSLPDDHGLLNYSLDGGSNILTDAHPQPYRRDKCTQLQVKDEISKNVHCPLNDNCIGDDSICTDEVPHEHQFYITPQFKYCSGGPKKVASASQPLECKTEVSYASKIASESDTHIGELGELRKLDSFGRWMNKEIGKDCDDSLMASNSCNYWNALNAPSDDKEASSLSRHMQLDMDSLGPSLSQEQLFSILDFSPDWAYYGIETKILITGAFLGGIEPSTIKWCGMFGEQEVSAEVLTTNVIRCQAPPHSPGRVPFYITCNNRLACSEVREFEYRENLSGGTFSLALKSEPEEEVQLQVRFAKMLSLRMDRKELVCSVENCHKCKLKKSFFSLLSSDGHQWDKIEKDSKAFRGYHINHRNTLLEKLLKDMLYEWLVYKVHEEVKGPNSLDEEGQGAIHLAAALGYEWAMGPIAAAGVHPSFRDTRGRTALHWAAYFGREETVVALVKLGAASGAVDDPTSKFPGGQTAADLASSRGHKGVAGYLAEEALTSHLSSLTLRESMLERSFASLAAEEAVETVKEQSVISLGGENEQLSLRGSLAALRNSTLAAAQIQSAMRAQSFRQRQLREGSGEKNDIDDNALMLSSLSSKLRRLSHFDDPLHVGAVKIQQKYRGWKGRREFLKIRDRIVKIQAHVRGHQVRKQYKKVVWSVGIVEKAILRWRRKRSGLRGFRSEKTIAIEQEVGKTDEYEFLRLGRKQKVADVEKALARVQSMVHYPEARDQYMRLVARSHKSKLAEKGNPSPQVQHPNEEKQVSEKDLVSSILD